MKSKQNKTSSKKITKRAVESPGKVKPKKNEVSATFNKDDNVVKMDVDAEQFSDGEITSALETDESEDNSIEQQ